MNGFKTAFDAENAEKDQENAEVYRSQAVGNKTDYSTFLLSALCVPEGDFLRGISALSALKEFVSECSEKAFTVKRYFFIAALLSIFGAAVTQPVVAREAAPLAQDEAVEKRLVEISSELRCLVCQNESLSGSHAELANDLRREIREMIRDGKSDSEIMDFMVSRYGDFVRYRPPLKATTLLLWFGPALLLVGGLSGLLLFLHRRNKAIKDRPLSADEQHQADRLLNVKDPRS